MCLKMFLNIMCMVFNIEASCHPVITTDRAQYLFLCSHIPPCPEDCSSQTIFTPPPGPPAPRNPPCTMWQQERGSWSFKIGLGSHFPLGMSPHTEETVSSDSCSHCTYCHWNKTCFWHDDLIVIDHIMLMGKYVLGFQ